MAKTQGTHTIHPSIYPSDDILGRMACNAESKTNIFIWVVRVVDLIGRADAVGEIWQGGWMDPFSIP
jgi:hypothetical protein